MADIQIQKNEEKLEAKLTVTIIPDDYENKLSDKLREHRKKSNIPGFRPGKAPLGIIKKMIGTDLKKEVIPEVFGEQLQEFLKKEGIEVFSNPIVNAQFNDDDWKNAETFTWDVKIGIKPEITIQYDKLNGLTRYKPVIDDKVLESNLSDMLQQYGNYEDQEQVDIEDTNLILHTQWKELNESGEPLEGGVDKTVYLFAKDMQKNVLKLFEGLKPGEKTTVDVTKHFDSDFLMKNLELEENAVKDLHAEFSIEIVKAFIKKPAEINQELFDKLFEPGTVTNEQEFREKYRERLIEYYNERSYHELFERLQKKITTLHNPRMPEEFLKESFEKNLEKNENQQLSEDEKKKEFDKLFKQLQWNLVSSKMSDELEIQVEDTEIVEQAKTDLHESIRNMYGFSPDPQSEEFQNVLVKYVQQEENINRSALRVREGKLFKKLKEKLTFEEKEISVDEFKKIEEETFEPAGEHAAGISQK